MRITFGKTQSILNLQIKLLYFIHTLILTCMCWHWAWKCTCSMAAFVVIMFLRISGCQKQWRVGLRWNPHDPYAVTLKKILEQCGDLSRNCQSPRFTPRWYFALYGISIYYTVQSVVEENNGIFGDYFHLRHGHHDLSNYYTAGFSHGHV